MTIEPSAVLKFQSAIIEAVKRINRLDDVQTAHYIRSGDNGRKAFRLKG